MCKSLFKICAYHPAHPNRQLLMFSATMSRKVEMLASDALTSPIRITVGETGTANEDISQVGRAITVACVGCLSDSQREAGEGLTRSNHILDNTCHLP